MAKPKTVATQLIIAAIFAVVLPCLTAQSLGQAPMMGMSPSAGMAPSPGPDCFTYLLNMSDCLTFVQGGSNLTKPDPGCCPELANLVNTQPVCLCQLLGNPGQVGFNIDIKRALKLPSVCNVTTPPVSLCAAIGVPVGALTPTEAPSPGGPVAASPTPGGGNNEGSSNLASNYHFLIGLATVLFTYFL